MAQDSLSSRLQMAMRRITGKGKLNESDIDEMMREVRLSLLEADVNLKVIRNFTNNVKEKALGEKILKGLNPGQQVVKIVHDELKRVMGDETETIHYKTNGLTTIMTVGLQGTGKTTAIGKLGAYITKVEKKKVMFIAADIYRPAAIDQLVTLGKQIGVFVYEEGLIKAQTIVKNGLKYALDNHYDVVIIDTAGRLNIDHEMMQELQDIKTLAKPDEILLTVDAMTGQVAASVALSFHEQLNTTGAIITKLDGDTRGGAALSIREVAQIPIKFASTGEKLDAFEVFHPDRMASRILGMGDVLSLIESATQNISEDEAMGMMEKMLSGEYNYNDLLKQFKMIKRMGSVSKILGFMPGLNKMKDAMSNVDDKSFDKMAVLISSMTDDERKNPKLIDESSRRRNRIARGSGLEVSDVNRLRNALDQQKQMAKQMSKMSESDLTNMGNNPSKLMPKPKIKKGKGKHKGQFRF